MEICDHFSLAARIPFITLVLLTFLLYTQFYRIFDLSRVRSRNFTTICGNTVGDLILD